MSQKYNPTLPSIKEETEMQLLCEESFVTENSCGASFYDVPKRVYFDDVPMLLYYIKDEEELNVNLKDYTVFEDLARKIFQHPMLSFTEIGGDRNPQWLDTNWKPILERIVHNSNNRIMKWMVNLMDNFKLAGRYLQVDAMPGEFVKFWHVLIEYSGELSSEAARAGRQLVDDGSTIEANDAEKNDFAILLRDRSIHSDISLMRSVILELGHTVGSDGFMDNAIQRSERFHRQILWYSKFVMKLD